MKHAPRLYSAALLSAALLIFVPLLQAQLEHSPLSGGVLAARAYRAGKLHILPGSGVSSPVNALTCSNAPCIFPDEDASEGGFNPVNEDPVASNPNNAQQILTGGNDYNCNDVQGFFATSDGGATWTRNCLPLINGGFGEGDPIVGYDLNNVAYAGGIQSGFIVVSSSTNNGTTWGTPVKAVNDELGYLADKPWMEVDDNSGSPFKNSIYISSTQFDASSDSQIWVAHSTDGGKTWKDVAVSKLQHYPTDVDQFSDLAVGADGTVYLNWLRCPASGPSGDCGGTTSNLMFSKSTDGGSTWSTEVVAATTTLVTDPNFCCFYGQLPNTSERVSNIPANAVFGSGSSATVYITFYNWTGSQMQVEVAKSTDGGSTWGAPVRVNNSNNGDQFFQWMNVSQNGKLAVTWLDRRNDPQNLSYQPFLATSQSQGTTFSASHALTSTLSNPDNDGFGGGFMGDYRTNIWNGGNVYAVWMDTRTGTSQDQAGGASLVHFP